MQNQTGILFSLETLFRPELTTHVGLLTHGYIGLKSFGFRRWTKLNLPSAQM